MTRRRPLALLASLVLGCSSAATSPADAGHPTPEAGGRASGREAGEGHDAAPDVPDEKEAGAPDAKREDATADASTDADAAHAPDGKAPASASAIAHLVLIVQENHSFDNYFGRYCTAPTGSNPTCTSGPACCEAAPAADPTGAAPVLLNDAANGAYNPNHTQACEEAEMDNGLMDRFVAGTACASAGNVAYADSSSVATYWQLAGTGALADRYFQPVAGASTSNDMYLAGADFVFTDDEYEAQSKGALCQGGTEKSFTVPTVADLLIASGATFGVYAGGYAAAVAANPACAPIPAACPSQVHGYPCDYDPGDIPFEYYPSLRDNPLYMKDFTQLATDLASGSLPSFSFVKSIGYLSEHPGGGDTISGGEAFVQSVVEAIGSSPLAASTLILVTWDESGGYFDHVAPPPASNVDNQPYGPRVPLLALGPFARANYVSHVSLEHSSIVKFIEWNWLGQETGQLGTRDAVVSNLGSLLDPTATGIAVPE